MRSAAAVLAILALSGVLSAQTPSAEPPLSAEELRALRDELKALRREVEELKKDRRAAPATPAVADPGAAGPAAAEPPPTEERKPLVSGEDYLPEKSKETAEESRLPSGQGGLLDKPFLRRSGRNVYLGGYADFEYRDSESADHDTRFHRLIPFIYADVNERVKFATEIEIEDGHEIDVEFAFVDILFREEINFRAGVLLDPLGKLNLVHDSPIQDLTDRPLVDTWVLPSTLHELGLGFYGTIAPANPDSTWQVTYESYLVQGFRGLDQSGTNVEIDRTTGIRDARPHRDDFGRSYKDNNNSFGNVTRVAFSPFLGLETGASVHAGKYDGKADNWLMVYALDVTFQHGPFELLAEWGYDAIQRDDFARAAGIPDDLWGYYVQANYHFMPDFLKKALPSVFWESSTFTAVVRWEETDLDDSKRDRLTFGLNFRPIEDTVIKFDYQLNFEGGDLSETENDAFLFSIATYF